MTHRPLPAGPLSEDGPPTGASSEDGPGGGGASASGRSSPLGHRSGLAAVGLGVGILASGLIVALGLAALVGGGVRSALLVEVDRSPVASEPAYSDAPAEAAAFFSRRDTVRVVVDRDMSVADFLALYHLETNPSARAALRDQLGAVAEDDLLAAGDVVTLTVTVPGAEW